MSKSILPRRPISRRRALVLSGTALAVPMITAGVARAADDWPNRSVRYVVPFPAGGPTDTLSRIVCAELTNLTGQTFVIENKSGNGGVLGADLVAKATPDGYTIGLYTIAAHAIAPSLFVKMPFDAGRDVTGISILWETPNMLMTRLDFPANTVPELIALLKANPGKYSFASSGAGTSPQITGELFKSMAGVNILHVPYRAEFLPGFEIVSWGGFCGPAGMPKPMVEKANALLKQVLDSPKVMAAFEKAGATRRWLNPADTAKYRADNEAKLAPVIKASGAKVE
ncbi:MAG: hypothetical protein HYZ40_01950 [Rhodospirillales bacterium]|nr:hypothetical protein [Rhodospirillales bacterium]